MKKGSLEIMVIFSRVSHRLLNSSFHSYMTIKLEFSGSNGCRKNLKSISSQNQHTSKKKKFKNNFRIIFILHCVKCKFLIHSNSVISSASITDPLSLTASVITVD